MLDKFTNFTKKLFGDANERELKKLQPLVQRVNEREAQFESLTDEGVVEMTGKLKTRLANGEPLDDLLVDAFATVREAAKRTLGMRHYDCQLVGGIVLHQGKIAEMKTGEGKTLVATLPVYLNALEGKGCHVVTVNDYLAKRDAEWMGEIYRFLGMSVGSILSGERNDRTKRDAYASDITYGTNNEFGFDYLRDNMKFRLEDYVQRGHHYGIVDEVDSILIDEARTPLIISGPADSSVELYSIIDAVVPLLVRDIDFSVDEKGKSVSLNDEGVQKIEDRLAIDNLFDVANMEVLHHVNQSLKAHYTFKRDRDYVVRGGKVVIVDEFTGRLMHGRRWSDGLHQAVEAKEKVSVEAESQVYATITFQNLFRMYDKLSGMTGTAATEAPEFAGIYDLDTLVIPTNKPIARRDHDDVVYKTEMEKFRAVTADILEAQKRGQPVLVGTTSVEKSEILHQLLKRASIHHEVLNAKNHAREAQIVAQAGRLGAVTISTNMAGRGTDIRLGGNAEEMAAHEADPETNADAYAEVLATYQVQCGAEQKQVLDAGGLHIIGTERHDSRRVDNQLRGRSGRQGDPGSSKFFLCLEDKLLRLFGTDKLTVWMERMGLEDDEPIEHRWVTRAIENAQKKVEGHHFQMRKNILEYDDVMNYQRQGVYSLRKRALAGEGIREMVEEAITNVVGDIMDECAQEGMHPEMWDVDSMVDRLEDVFDIRWDDTAEQLRDCSRNELQERMKNESAALLEARIAEMGDEVFNRIGQMLMLQFTDQLWKDHLLAIDRLRQGVGLRGYGQRNPLLEYKREAYHMFLLMEAMRDEAVLKRIFKAEVAAAEDAARVAGKATARRIASAGLQGAAPAPSAPTGPPVNIPRPEPARVERPKKGSDTVAFAQAHGVRRNDPCPCGSGLKYKKCCAAAASSPAPAS